MLGDGKLSHFQVAVTLGNKEVAYATYVAELFHQIFGICPKIITDPKKGYRVVYLGSTEISAWLVTEGLVYNKVAAQVDAPLWIFNKKQYMERFVRGFFDTDGSIYKLKYGVQLSFTNYSVPLLMSLQWSLRRLGYRVSEISGHRFYLTKIDSIKRFFGEIQPRNQRHIRRFDLFVSS
jgi:DNA-binding transcriptional regulator WhiA